MPAQSAAQARHWMPSIAANRALAAKSSTRCLGAGTSQYRISIANRNGRYVKEVNSTFQLSLPNALQRSVQQPKMPVSSVLLDLFLTFLLIKALSDCILNQNGIMVKSSHRDAL